jgi:hypothetical protein
MKSEMAADQVLKRFSGQIVKEDAVYHYFRLWRNTSVWVHLYHGDREKPVTRLSSACSQAKLGLDLQAWIGGLLKGQPPTPGPKTLACGHAAP